MGLDWVVLGREENGPWTNPTEVLGVERMPVEPDDPEIGEQLQRMYARWIGERREEAARAERPRLLRRLFSRPNPPPPDPSFEEFLTEVRAGRIPTPIVVPFGPGVEDAIPAVAAEVQYYGYRGKAVCSDLNAVTRFGEESGEDLTWMWDTLDSGEEIAAAKASLERTLAGFEAEHAEAVAQAREEARRLADPEVPEEEKKAIRLGAALFTVEDVQELSREEIRSIQERAAARECVFPDLEAVEGAIRWLGFWEDKGFVIAADF